MILLLLLHLRSNVIHHGKNPLKRYTKTKNNLRNPFPPTGFQCPKRLGERGRKGKIVEVVTFSVILRNSELVTMYCIYDEILGSNGDGFECPSHQGCDVVICS
jgi:hypothetical protein